MMVQIGAGGNGQSVFRASIHTGRGSHVQCGHAESGNDGRPFGAKLMQDDAAQGFGIADGDSAGQGHRCAGAGHHPWRVGDGDAVIGAEKQFLDGTGRMGQRAQGLGIVNEVRFFPQYIVITHDRCGHFMDHADVFNPGGGEENGFYGIFQLSFERIDIHQIGR